MGLGKQLRSASLEACASRPCGRENGRPYRSAGYFQMDGVLEHQRVCVTGYSCTSGQPYLEEERREVQRFGEDLALVIRETAPECEVELREIVRGKF